jgi:hypothetical protein
MTVLRFLHNDSIASNITATVLWGGLALLWAERRIVRKLHALHRKHDQLAEQILRSPDGVVAPPAENSDR